MLLSVPLSRLVAGRNNPRKVKPDREAHHRLVALIRSQGLLQPLVVRCAEDNSKRYQVVAGNRRLAALREVHRDEDPKIPCVLRDVDRTEAEALSLGENFGREAMHPLDEAEAFARLARDDAKGVDAIAAEFGVSERYVRQRMKLDVDIRKHRRPDAAWLASYQKHQLAQLIVELKGPVHAPAPERKKFELVELLDKLFADAAEGKLQDKKLAERINSWRPANLRVMEQTRT
jgi:ParB/RepB/Spo0J family partition protein